MEDVEIIKVYKGNFNSKDIITILQTGGAGTAPFPEAPLSDKSREYVLFLQSLSSALIALASAPKHQYVEWLLIS